MSRSPALRWIRRHGAMVVLSGLVATAGGIGRDWPSLTDLRFAGLVQETRGPRTPPTKVAIVAIDDFSLQQAANADLSKDPLLQSLNQWPWPRNVHVRVLNRLFDAGASTVGFDLLLKPLAAMDQLTMPPSPTHCSVIAIEWHWACRY